MCFKNCSICLLSCCILLNGHRLWYFWSGQLITQDERVVLYIRKIFMSLLEYLCSDLQSTQLVIFQDRLNVNWLFMILCLDCPDLNYFVKLTGSNVLYISKVVISKILTFEKDTKIWLQLGPGGVCLKCLKELYFWELAVQGSLYSQGWRHLGAGAVSWHTRAVCL